jgi:ATP-dependent helicase/nuclease subunit A
VHYKLDQGIDHVLIDEAQDTSPKQWEIIRLLTGEFFAGAGARAVNRTIFAVGDEKQSIFSFQGAAPREFDAMRRTFATLCAGIDRDSAVCALPPLLPFGPNRARRRRQGVRAAGSIPRAVRRQCQARARMAAAARPAWSRSGTPSSPKDKREIEAWDAPFDELSERSPQVRLATKIAANVKRWTKAGHARR